MVSLSIARRLARLEALPPPPPPPPRWEGTVSPAVVAYLNALDGEPLAALRRAHDDKQGGVMGGFYFKLPDHRAPLPGVVVIDQMFEGIATRQTPTLTVRQAQARLLCWAYHHLGVQLADERRRAEAPGDIFGTRVTWERLIGAVPTEGERGAMVHRNDSHDRRHRAGELWMGYWRRGGTRDPATLAALHFGAAELALLAADDAPGTADGDEHGGGA